jgi:hypothetical protein
MITTQAQPMHKCTGMKTSIEIWEEEKVITLETLAYKQNTVQLMGFI